MSSDEQVLNFVKNIRDDIASLRIRGATRIAVTAMETIKKVLNEATNSGLRKVLETTIELLYYSRPTEPAMQNGLRLIKSVYRSLMEEESDADTIRDVLTETADNYLKMLRNAFNKIIEIGWKRVPDKGIMMTHCHSTTVVEILRKAKEKGKEIKVITSETRPIYQGRKTARELAESGIEVLYIVDSAMRWAAKKYKPDIALIGSDAIGSNGVIVNKIGSKLLALVAKEFDFPLYVTTMLLKLDLKSVLGDYIPMEMRDPKEIWYDAPEGVTILNPAFETVSPEYIDAIITEAGVIPPSDVLRSFKETYPKIWEIIKIDE